MSFLDSAFPAVVNTTGFDVEMYNRIVNGLTDLSAALAAISDQAGNISLGAAKAINWPTASLSWSTPKVQAGAMSVIGSFTYGTLAPGGDCDVTGDATIESGATLTLSGNLTVLGKIDVDVVTGSSMTIAQIAEPSDPADGTGFLWCSNGSGAGDVGDIMVKIQHGGVVKSTTLVNFV